MTIDELKKMIKNSTSVLVLEEGEPSFVILDYKAYKDIAIKKSDEKEIKIKSVKGSSVGNGSYASEAKSDRAQLDRLGESEREVLDRLNKEILALKDQIEAEERTI